MEGVGSDSGSSNLAGEDDEGDAIAKSVLHSGNDVGSSRSRSNENDTGFPGDASVALCHVARTLFMSGKDEVEMGRVVDGVENGQDGSTGISEDVLDAVPKHHLVEDLAAGFTDEGVIKVLFLGQRRGLVGNIAAVGEDRGRCRSPK